MRQAIALATILGLSAITSNCTTVPPLEAATNNFPFSSNIPIHDIVQRVKCELSDALDEKTQQPDFRWMADWTAKIDLTLEVNDTGGVSPGATYVVPLHNAYVLSTGPSTAAFPSGAPGTSVGATAQNFNLGFGLNLSGSADRTELLSFAVSLDELRQWRRQIRKQEIREGLPPDSFCHPPGFNDLQGGLDLKSWIDSALGPVEAHDLSPGYHPDPGTVAKAPAAKSTSPGNVPHGGIPLKPDEKAPYDFQMTILKDQIEAFLTAAQKSAEQAAGLAVQVTRPNTVTHRFDARIKQLAGWAQQQAFAVQQAENDAKKYYGDTDASKQISKADYTDDLNNVAKDLKIAGLNAAAADENASLAAKLANPDPPLDSITHSVQFIVTSGGSISPNWTFVQWKGPTPSGSLASLSGVRTHSLNIALGAPTGGGLTEVNRVLGNQAIRQAVQTIGTQ